MEEEQEVKEEKEEKKEQEEQDCHSRCHSKVPRWKKIRSEAQPVKGRKWRRCGAPPSPPPPLLRDQIFGNTPGLAGVRLEEEPPAAAGR